MIYSGVYEFSSITPLGFGQPDKYQVYYVLKGANEDQMRYERMRFALRFGVDLEMVNVRKVSD